MKRILVASLCLILSQLALAGSTKGPRVDSTKPDFQQQAQNVLKALDENNIFFEISPDDKVKVKEHLNHVSNKIVEQPSAASSGEISVKVNEINRILDTAEADSRMKCAVERPPGSNIPKRTCISVAQKRRNAERSQEFARNNLINTREVNQVRGN